MSFCLRKLLVKLVIMNKLVFPENFFWGSATSAHQIEGNNNNDWSEWEKSESRVSELRSRGLKPEDFISGKACDSYNKYREDIDIAKSLGHNMHRFSVEWSRIEPEEGNFDFNAIQHYKELVKYMKDRGIEPMVTLWHFTNPFWFSKDGGWASPKSPERFVRFIKVVVDNFSGLGVRYWATFNEALSVYIGFAYLKGVWPPQYKDPKKFLKARENILRAHTLAYRMIKDSYGAKTDLGGRDQGMTSHNVEVGLIENNSYVPEAKGLIRNWMRGKYKKIRNFYFFDKAAPHYDFIGLNYYNIDRKPFFGDKNEILQDQEVNPEMNWELYPPGIYHCLVDLKKYNKPIFITENGIADSSDQKRVKFIKDHLTWVHKAINDGVDVRGYLYWSLLDNFEWHHGFSPRFGLVEVDYKTFERRIRQSAFKYKRICEINSLEI